MGSTSDDYFRQEIRSNICSGILVAKFESFWLRGRGGELREGGFPPFSPLLGDDPEISENGKIMATSARTLTRQTEV